MPVIRAATTADMQSVASIYAHYVRNTAATFEIDPPDVDEMQQRRETILLAGLPYLVVEVNKSVVGYAYAGQYRPRPAYRYTVEDSIYIHPDATGRRLGQLLLAELIHACRKAGSQQMIAVIGDSANVASVRLHAAFGFRHVGVLDRVGAKFGRWYDTVLMQLDMTTPSQIAERNAT